MNNLDGGKSFLLSANPTILYTSYAVLVLLFSSLFFIIRNAFEHTVVGKIDNYERKINFTSRFVRQSS